MRAAGAGDGRNRTALDKKVQALITDMNQPLGYAIGNALEVMEVSQTLQKAGPADLTRLSLELAARMISSARLHLRSTKRASSPKTS
jgi:thymidine phosphorylase